MTWWEKTGAARLVFGDVVGILGNIGGWCSVTWWVEDVHFRLVFGDVVGSTSRLRLVFGDVVGNQRTVRAGVR